MNQEPKKPREGWAEKFEEMHAAGDDELLVPDVFPEEVDREEEAPSE